MIDIIGKRNIFLGLSGFVIGLGIIFVSIFGLQLGIDFKGGSLIEVSLAKNVPLEELRKSLDDLGIKDLSVQSTSANSFLIKSAPLDQALHQKLLSKLENNFGQVEEKRYESIGPSVGQDLQKRSLIALALTSLLIVLYLAWAFRKVSRPVASWKYGVCAVLALIHDLLVTIGLFSIASRFFDWQIDTFFVTALLTILGFSVHDTIVVFDRLRENLKSHFELDFEKLVNFSINQVLVRSLITSFTIMITLLALFFLGGATLKSFTFALIIGMFAGTYSSIFIASPLLVIWQDFSKKLEK